MPLIIFLILILAMPSAYAKQSSEGTQGYVQTDNTFYAPMELERVIDGDTIAASGKKIRLWGIDAPEKDEELYAISTKALEAFLYDKELSCKTLYQDKYKRYVMHCLINGVDLGAVMVKAGFAKDYPKYSGGFYKIEQDFAKGGELGVWKKTQFKEDFKAIMCTMDAKVCPDGSFVSRTGPNCEFAECPSLKAR